MQATNASQRQSAEGGAVESPSAHSRAGDRLVQFAEAAEITTLTENTLRWLRHKNQGPPFFRMGGRRLVIWESDLYRWIDEQAAS